MIPPASASPNSLRSSYNTFPETIGTPEVIDRETIVSCIDTINKIVEKYGSGLEDEVGELPRNRVAKIPIDRHENVQILDPNIIPTVSFYLPAGEFRDKATWIASVFFMYGDEEINNDILFHKDGFIEVKRYKTKDDGSVVVTSEYLTNEEAQLLDDDLKVFEAELDKSFEDLMNWTT